MSWVDAPTGPLAERAPDFAPPEDTEELGLAGFAKVLCSALFVSGRTPDEALAQGADFLVPGSAKNAAREAVVDRERREVRVRWQGVERVARYHGDQGCTLLPRGSDRVFFEPVEVVSSLPPAGTLPWPMGDAPPEPGTEPPPTLDSDLLATAVEAAFPPEALMAAFLVVHRGRIVAERYDHGATRDTQLESWSMGKSLTATLVGRLLASGELELDGPAPVPEWSAPGDPRGEITVRDLLQMSSGLRFVAPRDPDYEPAADGYPDHVYIYTGAIDAFRFSVTRPLEFEPGTVGRYRNSDPLTLGYLVRRAVEARGEEYLTYPQRSLFDRIGIRRQVLEVDPWGNFLLTGFDYGTARNWARLGMLYLADGVWQGERLLPEGFSGLVATPAPGWVDSGGGAIYGGLFWLNRDGTWGDLPADAYYMAGAGGQRTVIVPSLDLVVVRLGHFAGSAAGMEALDRVLGLLARAVEEGG